MTELGFVSGLAAALCFGLLSLVIRKKAARANIIQLNAATLTMTSVVSIGLVLVLGALGRHHIRLGHDIPLAVALLFASVLFSLALGNTIYFFALRWLGVTRALPLSLTEPLITTGLAVPLLGEHLTLGLGVAVVLIPIGVYFVSRPSDPDGEKQNKRAKLGILMALGAAAAWSLSAITMRPALDEMDALTATAIRAALGTIVLWGLTWRSDRWLGKEFCERPRTGVMLAAGAIFSANIILFAVCLAAIGAARATALSATAPLFALPIAAFWLGEKITRWTVVGTLMTVAGVILVVAL